MSRIQPLSADAAANITSSKEITTLQDVAIALVENSLDAGATKIDIAVDFQRGDCTIEDNGVGIPPAEFGEHGGLAKMYHTSKRCVDRGTELHGSNGIFLASLAALSLLKITSRYQSAQEEATLIMHHGKVISRHPTSQAAYAISDPPGTLVAVRNLFGNMPVRVKQRASFALNNTENEQVWLDLKLGMVALLLSWPESCVIRLHDAQNGRKATTLAGSASDATHALTERSLNRLRGLRSRVDFRDALPILIQAGVAPPESRHRWVDVSASNLMVSIRGAICLDPAPTKRCQFISIGIRPCYSQDGHHALYSAMNTAFAKSSFGIVDDTVDTDDVQKARRRHNQRYKAHGNMQKELQGRKGVDRWPMFVLQLSASREQQDVGEDGFLSDTAIQSLVAMLEAVATQWLAAHHMRPHQLQRRKNETQQHPLRLSSSPDRTMSAPNTLGTRALNTRPVTPAVKRAITAGNPPGSKRRRGPHYVDVGNYARSHPSVHGSSSYFDGLSRIKTGKRDICPQKEAKSVPDAKSVLLDTVDGGLVSTEPCHHPFKLPIIDVGELGSMKSRTRPMAGPHGSRSHIPSAGIDEQHLASSDQYGSVEDAALIAAEYGAIQQPCYGSTGDAAIDHFTEPMVQWVDPSTRKAYIINARTGVVLPSGALVPRDSQTPSDTSASIRPATDIHTTLCVAGRPVSLSRRPVSKSGEQKCTWLSGFLEEWQNPVYMRRQEQPIPIASLDGAGLDFSSDMHCWFMGRTVAQNSDERSSSRTTKLSRQALKQATVISQVDSKFILCHMPAANDKNNQMLVIVDQHAASERIILEQLLVELCQPAQGPLIATAFVSSLGHHSAVRTSILDNPINFDISQQEGELLVQYAQHFAEWGILYDLIKHTADTAVSSLRLASASHRIAVRTLPTGIAERCRALPNLLIELLRSEVWKLAQSSNRPRSATTQSPPLGEANQPMNGTGDSWLRKIGSCPSGILEMLKSRACRSAIMFNDVLTNTQCEELIADLSRCAFPFMCAHGRVSMVPLLQLSGSTDEEVGGLASFIAGTGFERSIPEDPGNGVFSSAFRRWRTLDRSVADQP